ncbi:MAG: hypothetical protein ACLQBD_03535 [Syntrophobacteraceae bacterium]
MNSIQVRQVGKTWLSTVAAEMCFQTTKTGPIGACVLSAKQVDFALRTGELKTCFDHGIVNGGGLVTAEHARS